MSRFICWYAYKGMETEGRLDLEEPQIVSADSVAEAMWIYQIKHRGVDMLKIYRSFEKYLSEGEFTGWGLWCEELKQ